MQNVAGRPLCRYRRNWWSSKSSYRHTLLATLGIERPVFLVDYPRNFMDHFYVEDLTVKDRTV